MQKVVIFDATHETTVVIMIQIIGDIPALRQVRAKKFDVVRVADETVTEFDWLLVLLVPIDSNEFLFGMLWHYAVQVAIL